LSFTALLGVALGFVVLTPIWLLIEFCFVNEHYMTRLRQVIAEESLKYSSRSPTPCTWKLDITDSANPTDENSKTIYCISISLALTYSFFSRISANDCK